MTIRHKKQFNLLIYRKLHDKLSFLERASATKCPTRAIGTQVVLYRVRLRNKIRNQSAVPINRRLEN